MMYSESDTESIIWQDEKSLDDTIRDLRTYIGCLVNLTLSLEHPVPDPVEEEAGNTSVVHPTVTEAANTKETAEVATREVRLNSQSINTDTNQYGIRQFQSPTDDGVFSQPLLKDLVDKSPFDDQGRI